MRRKGKTGESQAGEQRRDHDLQMGRAIGTVDGMVHRRPPHVRRPVVGYVRYQATHASSAGSFRRGGAIGPHFEGTSARGPAIFGVRA